MAKYTIELRKVCDLYTREEVESWFKEWNLEDYLTQEEIDVINERGTYSKDRLARMIVNHYYMREIGQETPALFHLMVSNRMAEIMEEYAPKIYSASIKFDPLVNVDFEEVYNREINDTGLSNSSGLSVNSDTPQGQINKAQILQGKFASATSASEGESNTSSQSLETSSKRTKGNSGVSATAQALIKQYRDIIITINKDIIKDLNDLFMGLY